MRRLLSVLTLACTFSAAAACGGNAASGEAPDNARPAPRAGGSMRTGNVVLAEDIQRHGGSNLYDVLRALRPAWFRTTPTRVTGRNIYVDPIIVYVDGRRMGTVSHLSEIPVSIVQLVRYYTASEAQGRFGLDNLQGAIEVVTAR